MGLAEHTATPECPSIAGAREPPPSPPPRYVEITECWWTMESFDYLGGAERA